MSDKQRQIATSGTAAISVATIVTNGAFAADTDWTKGTGWTIAAGVATCSGAQVATSNLTQAPIVALVAGQSYSVTFTISNYSAGNAWAKVGATSGTSRAANGTFTETIVAAISTTTIGIGGDLDFAGNIDDLSITAVDPQASFSLQSKLFEGGRSPVVSVKGLATTETISFYVRVDDAWVKLANSAGTWQSFSVSRAADTFNAPGVYGYIKDATAAAIYLYVTDAR